MRRNCFAIIIMILSSILHKLCHREEDITTHRNFARCQKPIISGDKRIGIENERSTLIYVVFDVIANSFAV